MENCKTSKNGPQLSEVVAGLFVEVICTAVKSSFTETVCIYILIGYFLLLLFFNFVEVSQDCVFKMESPSDPAVVSPSTPQACASPPSPRPSSSRKQVCISELLHGSYSLFLGIVPAVGLILLKTVNQRNV